MSRRTPRPVSATRRHGSADAKRSCPRIRTIICRPASGSSCRPAQLKANASRGTLTAIQEACRDSSPWRRAGASRSSGWRCSCRSPCWRCSTWACRAGRSVPRAASLVLRPGGDLPELPPDDVVGQFFGAAVRQRPHAGRKPPSAPSATRASPAWCCGRRSLDLPYWAKVQELRDAVLDFREVGQAGRGVPGVRRRSRVLPGHAPRTQVYLLPASPLDLTGVASYEIFLRGALDKLGVQPEFLHIGDYKTAPNQLTETGDDTGAPRDGRVAQSRGLRPAGARHRRSRAS